MSNGTRFYDGSVCLTRMLWLLALAFAKSFFLSFGKPGDGIPSARLKLAISSSSPSCSSFPSEFKFGPTPVLSELFKRFTSSPTVTDPLLNGLNLALTIDFGYYVSDSIDCGESFIFIFIFI